MFLSCCLLCLSSFLGVMSQTLTQSSSEIKKPGERVKMSCVGSGFQISSTYISWVQQVPGRGLTWIGRIDPANGNTVYSSSYQGRFIITSDKSINTAYLQIDNVKVEDTATYYCARWGGGRFDVWGQGTFVTVTSAEPKGPSLFPLISCGTSQEKNTIIGCLAKDFLPGSIDFSWADQQSNDYKYGLKNYNSVLQSGGTYTASSQIKVPTDGWQNSDPYYCTAKHFVKNATLSVQLPRVEGIPPTVTIHPPMKDDVALNKNGTIVCIASGFYPKNIQVSWKKNSEEIHNAVTEEAVSNGNGGFIIRSYIVVSEQDWNKDITFSCIVKHDASKFHESKNVSTSIVCDPQPPGAIKVTAVLPSFETIYFRNIAPLTCIISNMENKDGLEVTWFANDEKINNTEIEDPTYDISSGKYTAKAIATVCPEDWRTKTFKCTVSHPELPSAQSVTIRKPNGQDAKAPLVLIYPPHPEELAKKETATMSCLVKGFFPADIFVRWVDSDDVEQSHVATTGPIKEITSSSKQTYFLLSTLTLTSVQDWNNGKSYTCIVGHESLPLQTTQRTIDKTSARVIYIEEDDEIDNLWTTASTFIVLFLLSLFYSATVTLFKVK